MGLKTSIIAAEINNLSDARYFAAFPVEWMAFTCNPISRSYIPIDKVKEIIGWINGPKIALDIRGCSAHQTQELLSDISADALILDNHQTIAEALTEHFEIFRFNYILPQADASSLLDELSSANDTDSFILDFELNQIKSDVILSEAFEAVFSRFSCYVKANMGINEVSQLLDGNAKGMMILGGNEEKVGIRSFDDVQDLMESLEDYS